MHDIPPNLTTVIIAVLSSAIVTQWIPSIFAWVSTHVFGRDRKATLDDVMKKVEEVSTVTSDNRKAVVDLKEHLKEVEDKTERNNARTARRRILEFNDEVIRNESEEPAHTKESWQEIMRDIDFYEDYTQAHPEFKNNYANESIRNLKEVFALLMKEHKF